MTKQITEQQWRDIRTLHEDHRYGIIDAVLIVTADKRKIRAPTMAELEQHLKTKRLGGQTQ